MARLVLEVGIDLFSARNWDFKILMFLDIEMGLSEAYK